MRVGKDARAYAAAVLASEYEALSEAVGSFQNEDAKMMFRGMLERAFQAGVTIERASRNLLDKKPKPKH
jgi:hypothetical protein